MVPACIVSDLNMPGMSGDELLQGLRDRNIQVPVIIVSGEPDAATPAGAFARLPKPFKDLALREAIERALLTAPPRDTDAVSAAPDEGLVVQPPTVTQASGT